VLLAEAENELNGSTQAAQDVCWCVPRFWRQLASPSHAHGRWFTLASKWRFSTPSPTAVPEFGSEAIRKSMTCCAGTSV
jgi:hypothetical protein